jgi:hypothetical protein
MSSRRNDEIDEESSWMTSMFPSDSSAIDTMTPSMNPNTTTIGNSNHHHYDEEDVTWDSSGLDGFVTATTTETPLDLLNASVISNDAFALLHELELDSEDDGVYERDESYDPVYEQFSDSFAGISDEEIKCKEKNDGNDDFASNFPKSTFQTEYHVDQSSHHDDDDDNEMDKKFQEESQVTKKVGILGSIGVAAVFAQQIMSRIVKDDNVTIDESDLNLQPMPSSSTTGQHVTFFEPSSSATTTTTSTTAKAAAVGGSSGGDGGGTITTVLMMNSTSSSTTTAATTGATATGTGTTTATAGTSGLATGATTTTTTTTVTTHATV